MRVCAFVCFFVYSTPPWGPICGFAACRHSYPNRVPARHRGICVHDALVDEGGRQSILACDRRARAILSVHDMPMGLSDFCKHQTLEKGRAHPISVRYGTGWKEVELITQDVRWTIAVFKIPAHSDRVALQSTVDHTKPRARERIRSGEWYCRTVGRGIRKPFISRRFLPLSTFVS